MGVNDYLAISIGYLSNISQLLMAIGAISFADLLIGFLVSLVKKARSELR